MENLKEYELEVLITLLAIAYLYLKNKAFKNKEFEKKVKYWSVWRAENLPNLKHKPKGERAKP